MVHDEPAFQVSARRSPVALSKRISVEGVAVVDGNTLVILEAGKPYLVRLLGIEAPERAQAYGETARDRLAELVIGRRFVAMPTKSDDCVAPARIDLGNAGDLAERLLSEGLAWTTAEAPEAWRRLEARARVRKIGLWGDSNPEPPWEFRRRAMKRDP